jgi:cytochrome c556
VRRLAEDPADTTERQAVMADMDDAFGRLAGVTRGAVCRVPLAAG